MLPSKDLTDLDLKLKRTYISAESFKRNSSFDISKNILNIHKSIGTIASHTRKLVVRVKKLESISGEKIGQKLSNSSSSKIEESISSIANSISSISDLLVGKAKLDSNLITYQRRKDESEKRELAESNLEKRFEGLKKVAEKIIAPVKSVLDRIIDFFVTVFLGRVVFNLIKWFGDKDNASKVKSIIRFLGDHWPKLLSLYLIFGTSFGKFARGLLKVVTLGVVKLAGLIAKLAAAKKVRGARGVAKFLGGSKGRAISGIIGTGVALGGTYAAAQALNGGGDDQKRQAYNGGGFVIPKIPTFSGGGLNLRSIVGKFGTVDPSTQSGGFVSGEKGIDKVPAMLSDGEFVMSRGAVAKYGVDTLEAMNAAGGGTNRPKVVSGTTYAAGGGLVGSYNIDNLSKNSGYYIREILKGLSPQYQWANGLVRQAGISAQNALNKTATSAYDGFMNEGARLHGYLTRGGVEGDIVKYGNRAVNSLQSNFNTIREIAKKTNASIDNLGSGERYQRMSKNNEKKSQEAISKYDSWVKSLPKGFLKDTMNRGLIPIPTGNELGMSSLTYIKAMLGPLGRPFKIMSNESVDKARQEMIDRTASANGLRVGSDGKLSMEWNRVSGKGSGQYTDEFDALGGSKGKGKFLNSTFGRWSGKQQGDKIVTDDVYNFNQSIGYYAGKSRDALLKGNIGEGLYNIASMAGRFAQDIGWMNQRALGSEIEVGSIKNIDTKTGKPKPPPKPPESMTLYGKDDPRRKQSGPYKSRFARPRNAGIKPVQPPTKPTPKVIYGPPVPSSKPRYSGGQRSASKAPRFSTTSPKNGNRKNKILGIF